MRTNETLLDGWEVHRIEAGDMLDIYLSKYSKPASALELEIIKTDVEKPMSNQGRPGLQYIGSIKFKYQLITYIATYETHSPMHSGADDFTVITTVRKVL